ncbi:MAG: bacillithiol biosynthesis BshC [Planctomycetes bacterium]|nr:bacillithiol biosynthesis BshC [Planctomycetota bacterium]
MTPPLPLDWCRAFAARWRGDRAGLAGLLAPGQAAEAVRSGGVLVVTGQQPAVGGGPLYTLFKAVHAASLAAALRQAGIPAGALFWCASDDHDLDEAGHADLVLRDARLARFRGDLGAGRAALRHRPALRWWPGFHAWCRQRLGPGLGAAWIADHAPLPDEGLGAWHCRLITALVPGLDAVEAWRLRPLWGQAMAQAIASWPAEALAARRAELIAGGSDPLGELAQAPVFADSPAGRRALAPAEALDLTRRDPGLLSPGAALRPVLQQIALPAACAVLGPGERAYHAAIPPLYAALGAPEPLHIPRLSRTLLPGWLVRACQAAGLEPAAVAEGRWSAPAGDPALAELDLVLERLAASHPRRSGNLARLRRERDRLAAGLARDTLPRPTPALLRDWLRPCGKPQERVMCLLQAVWEHGPGLTRALAGNLDPRHTWVPL